MQTHDTNTQRKMLGETLQAYRKTKGISQEKLAEMLDVHRNYVGRIERGEQNITFDTLCGIAQTLGISLSELFVNAQL
ncbi:MAG: helix-turn-helix transcriptional regulator [Kiritimatiellales bacterium]